MHRDHPRHTSDVMRVWVLGGFRVQLGSRTINEDAWGLRKAAAIVKLLSLSPRHRLHREQVMDHLWPQLGKQAAANNLRRTLHAARRTLQPRPDPVDLYLSLRGEQIALCPDIPLYVDVEAFEDAAAAARHARDPASYGLALDLYEGDLLPEDRYAEWTEDRRAQLRNLYLALLIELARVYEERGDPERAVEALEKVARCEPAHERASAALTRLNSLSNRPGEALAHDGRLQEKILSGRLVTGSGVATRHLRREMPTGRLQRIRPTGPRPEEPSNAGKHNLPAPRTSFVGREREMVEVKRALAMTRLLTLTGPGGSGKTRFALEVARDLVSSQKDGVWLVELAGLSQGELVPQAVAEALGLREQPGRPLTDTLVDALRIKEMLLLVDNCEHLLGDTTLLVDSLLDACPRLRVLATSREILGMRGEINLPVPSLSSPDPGTSPSVSELQWYESSRLFVERAICWSPAFVLTMEAAPAVADICRQLDGIPLAIELAAAWVGTLAVGQISGRLGDSLKLLTGGDRTAMPRQQTLRGTMDWSYDLLSEPEKKLYCRLSAFERGWTLEAAEVVGAGEGIEDSDVLEVLSGLVNKSLVLAETTPEDGMRYRMLQPIRQYAREKLEGGEDEEVVRRRHAVYFLDVAKRAAPQLKGHGQLLWLERLSREHDDLRAAIRWLLEEGKWEMAVRLGWELYLFWWIRGHFTEGRRWMERALEKGGAAMRPLDRARALYVAGTLATGQADYRQAQELVEESKTLFEEAGDEEGAALALGSAGIATVGQERYEMGIAILEEAAGLHRKLGYEWETAAASALAAGAWLGVGNHGRAAQWAEEALVLVRKMGDKTVISAALHVLATVAYASNERERARELFAEGLTLAAAMGDAANVAYYLEELAGVAASEGGLGRAARLWGAAEALLEKIEAAAYTHRTDRSLHQARVSSARVRLDEGSWTAAWAQGRTMSRERAIEYALSDEAAAAPETSGSSRRARKDVPPTDDSPVADPHAESTLTRRERQIVGLISRGLTTNRQISAELAISERTVETHVRNILKKSGLSSRTQLAARLADWREFDDAG